MLKDRYFETYWYGLSMFALAIILTPDVSYDLSPVIDDFKKFWFKIPLLWAFGTLGIYLLGNYMSRSDLQTFIAGICFYVIFYPFLVFVSGIVNGGAFIAVSALLLISTCSYATASIVMDYFERKKGVKVLAQS